MTGAEGSTSMAEPPSIQKADVLASKLPARALPDQRESLIEKNRSDSKSWSMF